ncbi:MAG: hypothetical protein ABIE23_02990 [archaeon]
MTTKNSILLIIKQNQGISYNALLGKIASGYNSVNSARATLSRFLKEATSFGLVNRRENNFFITDKGTSEINREMKNKLVIKLNQLIQSKSSVEEIPSIVEKMQILIERSKNDNDLLKLARNSAEFSLSELDLLKTKLDKRIKHLNYLNKVFSEQLQSLKELSFNDSLNLEFNSDNLKKIKLIAEKMNIEEFLLESSDKEFLEKTASEFNLNPKANNLSLPFKSADKLIYLIEERSKTSFTPLTIYFSNVKVMINPSSVQFTAPFNVLNELIK